MPHAFRLTEVIRTFPGFQLGPLNMELVPGTALGFIGPNGSGKTTTMRSLMRLLSADSGTIEVFGRRTDPHHPQWKRDIGYVGDSHVFYERWTSEKNLTFRSQFYPNWSGDKAARLAERFRLPLHKKAEALSTGNRVKLSLVAALAHSPQLLILDDPTSGIDPVIRAEIQDVLFETLESGESGMFYATHVLSDISRLVDELAFLNDGRVVLRATKEDLIDKWRRLSFRTSRDNVQFNAAVSVEKEGVDHRLISSDVETTLAQLRELSAESIQESRMSIEEIAVQIMRGMEYGGTP